MPNKTEPELNDQQAIGNLTTCPSPIDKNIPDKATMLEWTSAERLVGFRNDWRAHPGDVFHKSESPSLLPQADQRLTALTYRMDDEYFSLHDYLERQKVVGLLIIKDGKKVCEHYRNGNNATTFWTSRSVGKAVVSTLVGVALKEKRIPTLDALVTDFKPELVGSAWEGVTLKNLMQHTSGVEWNEDYTDPASDFSKLTRCEAGADTYECVSQLVYGVKRKEGVRPGELWSYNTGGSWLLGDILEGATGRPLAGFLEEKIWKPFGMARDGIWHAYVPGLHNMGGHGFNATLEDWGRFGQFVLAGGELPGGEKILPENWFAEASNWNQAKESVSEKFPEGTFGYQWWNNRIPEGEIGKYAELAHFSREPIWAFGIFGQLLAVNHTRNIVMAQWSNWDTADDKSLQLEAALFLASATAKLAGGDYDSSETL